VRTSPAVAPVIGSPPQGAPPGNGQSTVDVAKDQAAQVSQDAVEAGQHVAEVAKDQVGALADEAGRQAKDLLAQARSELTQQAGQQQQRIAETLRALGEELHAMTAHEGQSGVATDLVHQGAQKSNALASWLEQREPGRLVEEVKSFARNRPGSFLLLAAGLGLAAGRLTRGVKDAASDGPTTNDHAADHSAPASGSLAAPYAGDTAELPPQSHAVRDLDPGVDGSTTLRSDAFPAGGGI
jgi:hypothetical protein